MRACLDLRKLNKLIEMDRYADGQEIWWLIIEISSGRVYHSYWYG